MKSLSKGEILLLLYFIQNANSLQNNTAETKAQRLSRTVDSIFQHYDKAFRPDNQYDESAPLEVNVSMHILNFGQFDANNMRFNLLMEIEQTWFDMRLVDQDHKLTGPVNLSGEKNKLWVPDLYFPKSEGGMLHRITEPNFLVWFLPNGRVTYAQKLTVTLGCTFDLSRFPMDYQFCPVDISSYGYSKKEIKLGWTFGNQTNENIVLKKKELNELTIIRVDSIVKFTCGEVYHKVRPCIQGGFHFKRNLQYYMMRTYFPNILVVIISWLSFLIDFTVAPARVTLGLVAVLAIITQTNMVYQSMPKISYVKAIDVWLFTCLSFVVIGLLEFAFVNSLCRDGIKPIVTIHGKVKSGLIMLKRCKGSNTSNMDIEEAVESEALSKERKKEKKWFRFQKAMGYKIDGLFFVIYPIIFLIFNIGYWLFFLNLEEED